MGCVFVAGRRGRRSRANRFHKDKWWWNFNNVSFMIRWQRFPVIVPDRDWGVNVNYRLFTTIIITWIQKRASPDQVVCADKSSVYYCSSRSSPARSPAAGWWTDARTSLYCARVGADVCGGRGEGGASNFASKGKIGDCFGADGRRSHRRVGAFAARTKDWME